VILSSELPFPAFIEQAIERSVWRSRLTLAVLSPAYLRDRWASFAELLSRQGNTRGCDGGSLVPLLIADCEVPPVLAQHAMLDGRTPRQWQASAARLRARLGRPEPRVEPIACPYPGMRPFSAETASQFHGRAREIDELLGRLRAGEQEIYVIGPSGSGKSSLVAAGVLPHLRGAGGDGGSFAVRTLRPGEHPARRLAEALAGDASLEGAVDRLLGAARCDRLLIFLDQLEELFALAGAHERGQFVRALRVLRADRRCHLIVALRADFYGALMSSELWPDIEGRFTRLEVAPLRGDALRQAIEAPAREVDVYLERVLVERLASDAAAEPGALPLLQEALVLLWQRRSHRLLRLASYEELGSDGRSGLAVALAKRADATLHGFTSSQQVLARRIFLRLVSFGEGRPDTRRQQPRAALSTSGGDAADFDEVIRRLIDERMLTSDATAQGEPLVDLSHEALIGGWPAFQGWLLSRREDEQHRRLLELHVAEWVKRGRSSVGLFDAVELAEAERWIAGEGARELGYSEDLPPFLAASREAIEEAERQQQHALEEQACERRAAHEERVRLRRRLARFATVALFLFAIVASVLGLAARRGRNAARLQLGLNEQEQARALIVERRDPISAIPHLVHAVNLGVDNPVLRSLLMEVRHGMWKVEVRHGGAVQTAVFSPDGARLVTASEDGTARVWDAATGAPVGVPLQHEQRVLRASFSPDGTRVVTASEDGTARIWDAATGTPVGVPLKHEQMVRSATFSPDGTRVLTASNDGTARIWDAASGAAVVVLLKQDPSVARAAFSKQDPSVTRAAFSADGMRVVTASADGTVRVWDAASGTPVGLPLTHGGRFVSAALSPDGTRVVTAGEDESTSLAGMARIWDVASGTPVGAPLKHERIVWSAVFSPDGSRVLTASGEGTARIWDAASGTPVGVPLQHEKMVSSAVFSPDGSRVLTASYDGTARIWDATTGVPMGVPLKHDKGVWSAAFSPDGTRVVTASFDGTARIWDVAMGSLAGVSLKQEQMMVSAVLSPDGTRVVTTSREVARDSGTASEARTARIWDVASGTPVGAPLKHEQVVKSALFSPDGTQVVTASFDGTVRIWDAATGTPVGVALKHSQPARLAALNVDRTRVVTVISDGTAHIWNAVTGTPVGVPLESDEPFVSVALSPDGTRVVTASLDGTARIWDAATGTPVGIPLQREHPAKDATSRLDGTHVVTASRDRMARPKGAATGPSADERLKHDSVYQRTAFSPDGTRVVTASYDGTARIWDVATGVPLGVPLKHEKAVVSAAFSPDGTRVVTASWDRTARIWDVVTGAPVGLPLQHEVTVMSAVFSSDGTCVVTVDDFGIVRVWDIGEAGLLSSWVEQAMRCVAPRFDAAGSFAVCPLSQHETTLAEVLARVRTLMAAGDAAMRFRTWSVSRADYQQATTLLDGKLGTDRCGNQHIWADPCRAVSTRVAILDALEGRLQDARTHFGAKAPKNDALLLNQLGGFVYEDLQDAVVARDLLLRARELNPQEVSVLVSLVEVYFGAGQYEESARTAEKIEKPEASTRVAIAALAWAGARLTRAPEAAQAAQLMRVYGELANVTFINWSWRGTRHVLEYGHFRFEEVKPILDVLALLGREPVTDKTRARLASLLQVH
jgi:WD40 repeat protein